MTDDGTRPELHIDEDWKSKVKAEDAALDAKLQQGQAEPAASQASPSSPESDLPDQFPPADFAGLVMMLSTQAMVGMGVIPIPGQDQPVQNLAMAKYFIDLLTVLEEKTKNKLDRQENNLLIETLHQLRLAYVEAGKQRA